MTDYPKWVCQRCGYGLGYVGRFFEAVFGCNHICRPNDLPPAITAVTVGDGIRVKASADGVKVFTDDGHEFKCVTSMDISMRVNDVVRAKMEVFVSELDLECVGEITTVKILETGKRYRVVEELKL